MGNIYCYTAILSIEIQRDLDVPSSSVPKKYDGASKMSFRAATPPPLQAKYDTNIILLFQIYDCMILSF